METVARKIGNSVGAIFPKDISPKVGEAFTILKVGEAYILKPKKEDIVIPQPKKKENEEE